MPSLSLPMNNGAPQTTFGATPFLRLNASSLVSGTSVATIIVAAFAFSIAFLLRSGHSGILSLLYPAAALATGAILFFVAPARYISFVWWLWIVTPFVRRVVDAQNGFNAQNPILLAPLLVCALGAFDVVRLAPKLRFTNVAPFTVALLCLVGGVAVGLTVSSPPLVFYAALTWCAPLLLGAHVVLHPERHDAYHKAITTTLVVGITVLAVYGCAQFYAPATWDRMWMVNSRMDSIGQPAPFQVRVFSLMNAPGPLGQFLCAGLLILLANRARLKTPALYAGIVLLLLSLSRSAWLGFAVGFVYLLFFVGGRSRRTALAIIGTTIAIIVAFQRAPAPRELNPLRRTIENRVTTMTDLSMDVSYRARSYLIPVLKAEILSHPLGNGLGATLVGGARGATSNRLSDLGLYLDNGILETFLVLGWLGGLMFLASSACVVAMALLTVRRGEGANGYVAGAIALFTQLISGTIFFGVGGAAFWTCAAMAITSTHSTSSASESSAKGDSIR